MLVASSDGQQVGSVSGGCVEEDLLERLRAGEFDPQRIHLQDYGVSPEENERLGLPCGGQLKILLQALTKADCLWLDRILESLADRQCIERQLDLESGRTLLVSGKQFADLSLESSTLRQSFGPQMRMLLVGAGQLAQSLSELALAMDYDVMVTDTRQLVLSQWEGPDVPLLQGMPDDIVREHASDRRSIIITLTHDPRIDDMALMEALGTEAWYVGALGSMRTTAARLERLRQLDIPQEQIDRLYAPVGLDIGSKTPHEIAISIMAQLVQLRRSSR
ncbi:MAG: xanthine dehydrogenase accessory factor [Halieaceae bacterium]|jgi:xanthine dehydrogenase accessory factor